MGEQWSATCKNCEHYFWVSEGSGFNFHLLRCDTCGKERTIRFKTIGEIHLRYLKGLTGPYCIASSLKDAEILKGYKGEPMTEVEYYKAVESLVRKCRCGGHFTFSSPPRCPKCHSVDLNRDGGHILFD